MRDHGKLSPQFWIGETGRRFRGDAVTQVVALYLISSPHATMIGLYYLPLHLIAHETGQPLEAVQEALRKIEAAGFAHYSTMAEHVWVPEMAKHQLGDELRPKDNRVAWARSLFEQMAKSPFAGDFLARYGRAYHMAVNPPSKPLRSPFEAPSKGGSEAKGGDGDGDGDGDTHKPLPGAFGVCDEKSTPPNTEQAREADDVATPPTCARDPDEAFADDQHGSLLATWNCARKKSRLPAESLTDRHREAFSALLVATDGDRALAEAAIHAYVDWRDPKLVEAWWSINVFPHRISACVAKGAATLERVRRSTRTSSAPADPEEAPVAPEVARDRLRAMRDGIGRGAAHAAPTEA